MGLWIVWLITTADAGFGEVSKFGLVVFWTGADAICVCGGAANGNWANTGGTMMG